MSEKTARAGGRRKDNAKKVTELVKKYPIIGVVDMNCLPTPQLQRMRAQLRGQVEIFMAKKKVMQKAIAEIKDMPGIHELNPYMEKALPALLLTKENPFKLFKILKQNKSKAPAKAGQLAPNDIIIPAGPTPFAPGPVIGELGMLGIKTGVEGGKISIKVDTTVCKAGNPISDKLASLLLRLGIEPMEIGLDLKVVYEKGILYPKKVLDIDETKFMSNLMTAVAEAYTLAIEAAYASKDTTEELLMKAFREARAVAEEGKITCSQTTEEKLGQAEKEMNAVQQTAGIHSPEKTEHHSEKKETPKEHHTEHKQEPVHPKQGHVTQDQAADLLNKLQKEGTLRKTDS